MVKTSLITASGVLALAFLAGCAGPTATTEPKPSTGTTAGATAVAAKPAEPPKPDKASIPDALKYDAVAYYGLMSGKTLVYNYIKAKGATPEEGTQAVVFNGMKDGNAEFSIARTGSLGLLGSDDISVRADGIFTTNSAAGKIDPPMLALPKGLTVGKSWNVNQKMTIADSEVEMKMTNTVARQEKVKVPAGEFEAIVVTAKGTLKSKDKTQNVEATAWYAKDIGVIRISMKSVDAEGNPTNPIIELKSMN